MQDEPTTGGLSDRGGVRVADEPAPRGDPEPGGLGPDELGRSGEEVRDRPALVAGVAIEELAGLPVERLELGEDLLGSAGQQPDDDPPPVDRVGLAPGISGLLESVQDPGDRPARKAAELGQPTGGEVRLQHRQLETAEVGGIQPEAGREGVVEGDRPGSEGPAEATRRSPRSGSTVDMVGSLVHHVNILAAKILIWPSNCRDDSAAMEAMT